MAPVGQLRVGQPVADVSQQLVGRAYRRDGKDEVVHAVDDVDGELQALLLAQHAVGRGAEFAGDGRDAGEQVGLIEAEQVGERAAVGQAGQIHPAAVHGVLRADRVEHRADGRDIDRRTQDRPSGAARFRRQQNVPSAPGRAQPCPDVVVSPSVAAVQADDQRPVSIRRVGFGHVQRILGVHVVRGPVQHPDVQVEIGSRRVLQNLVRRSVPRCPVGGHGREVRPFGIQHVQAATQRKPARYERAAEGRPGFPVEKRAAGILQMRQCRGQRSVGRRPVGWGFERDERVRIAIEEIAQRVM